MLPTFHTARLTIRPLEVSDLDPMFQLIYSDPVVRHYFTNRAEYSDVAEMHAQQLQLNTISGGFGYWTVLRHDQIIGKMVLDRPAPVPWITLDPRSPTLPLSNETELGYAFGRQFWGQGYALEACHALIPYAFDTLGLTRLIENINRSNLHSKRLLERLGARFEDNLKTPESTVGVLTPGSYRRP